MKRFKRVPVQIVQDTDNAVSALIHEAYTMEPATGVPGTADTAANSVHIAVGMTRVVAAVVTQDPQRLSI